MIKSSQIARFKSFNFIEYGYGLSNEPFVCIPFKQTFDTIFRLIGSDSARYKNDWFQLNESGKIIDFRLCKYYDCPVGLCDSWEPVIESIHNHFLDLFGNSVEYRWSARTEPFHRRPKVFIPKLKNLSVLNISCDESNMKTVDNYFLSSPVLKGINFYINCKQSSLERGLFSRSGYSTPEEPFPPESKLYQAESIGITQTEVAIPAVLRHFQGRQAFINCDKCEDRDLIEFVNRWKSGEDFRNLEYLKVELEISEIHQNQILAGIRAKNIDTTRNPPTHTLPKRYIDERDDEPNTDPIISHTYVVRESDGRVASVLVQAKTFSFGVWDKTEEEFLRMVE
ncbi:unnamed protein product [Caenorhabditis nigoni]